MAAIVLTMEVGSESAMAKIGSVRYSARQQKRMPKPDNIAIEKKIRASVLAEPTSDDGGSPSS